MMKKILVASLALVVAIGTFAFTEAGLASGKQNEQPVWYTLNPGGNPDNPADYTMATGGQQPSCEGDLKVCAIYAVPDASNSNRPRFDGSKTHDQLLIQDINQSQAGQDPSTSYVIERN